MVQGEGLNQDKYKDINERVNAIEISYMMKEKEQSVKIKDLETIEHSL